MSGPCRALFYQLTRSGLHETLLTILERSQKAGWPVMVRGTDRAAMSDLDQRLWSQGPDDAFLAHGLEGGPHDGLQPILLGTGALPNGTAGLVLIDGAQTNAAEAAPLERVWVLFDGSNDAQLSGARALWTKLTGAGLAAQYWSEESGKWALKVEKPAGPA